MAENMKDVFETMFTKMENFISTKTVVGEAIHVGDVTLLPLIDVAFGLGAGGGDGKNEKNDGASGAGGGLGAKITPSAVIVITNSTVQLVNVKNQDSVNKLVDMVPGIVSKLNFGSMFNKKNNSEDTDKLKFEEQTFTE